MLVICGNSVTMRTSSGEEIKVTRLPSGKLGVEAPPSVIVDKFPELPAQKTLTVLVGTHRSADRFLRTTERGKELAKDMPSVRVASSYHQLLGLRGKYILLHDWRLTGIISLDLVTSWLDEETSCR